MCELAQNDMSLMSIRFSIPVNLAVICVDGGGRPLAAICARGARAILFLGARVFARAGGALAAPAPPALLSRFLAGKTARVGKAAEGREGNRRVGGG
jgi:hypothetical protein